MYTYARRISICTAAVDIGAGHGVATVHCKLNRLGETLQRPLTTPSFKELEEPYLDV